MKILVTGGSGTVGKQLLAFLSKAGNHEVTVFDLPTKKAKKAFAAYQGQVRIIYGDITDAQEVDQVCREVDVVIHLAAIIPPLADENPALAYKVNVGGTQNIINSLEKHAPHAFLLFASSVSVYGDRLSNHLITVTDPLQASVGDEYAVTKIETEQLIQASSLDWSIFRLSAIFGPNNHQSSLGLMFHMPLSTQMEITTDQDTARAFFHAIDKTSELNRRIFNLGGGESCRVKYEEFLSKSFTITGLAPLDFPPKAFAEQNFHCGYYADGDELDNILSFRHDSIDSYYSALRADTSSLKKMFTKLFRKPIQKYLLGLSEPYHAYQQRDPALMERFFGTVE